MLFGNLSDWQPDPAIEVAGVDLALGRDRYITIRRAGGANLSYATRLSELSAAYRGPGGVDMPDEKAIALLQQAFAETIVIGWRGLKDGAGQDVPFSVENCIALFAEAPEIWTRVRTEAEQLANFRHKSLEADADTLGKS